MRYFFSIVILLWPSCVCIPPPVPGHNRTSPEHMISIQQSALVGPGALTWQRLGGRRSPHGLGRSPVCRSRFISKDGKVRASDPGGYRIRVDATCGVSEYTLELGATTLQRMTKSMPVSIFNRLARSASVGIFTARETLCVYPSYYAYISPYWCGASCYGTCKTSCTFDGRKYCSLAGAGGRRTVILDDNILCNARDPYFRSTNILVHEFSHTVHEYGLDSTTKYRLTKAFAAARAARTWSDRYAMSTVYEYFAVASTVFFNADHSRRPAGNMNTCGSSYCRTEAAGKYNLYAHDPTLYSILTYTFAPKNPDQKFNIGPCTKKGNI